MVKFTKVLEDEKAQKDNARNKAAEEYKTFENRIKALLDGEKQVGNF
jgi:hypothetical protein